MGSRSIIMKWLAEGRLSPEEERALPPGLLERLRQKLDAMVVEALDSGDAGELDHDKLNAILHRARDRVGIQRTRQAEPKAKTLPTDHIDGHSSRGH